MSFHKVAGQGRPHRSLEVLHRIQHDREVRFWFSANGELVGSWRTPLGQTCAVGHDRNGRCIVYRGMAPADKWGGRKGYIINDAGMTRGRPAL